MNEEQKDAASAVKESKSIRAALLASKSTVIEYSTFLRHLLAGLVDESIPVALVCPSSCDVDSIVSPSVEVMRYPTLELPLMGRYNRKIVIEQLDKFKPSVLHCMSEGETVVARWLARQLDLPYLLTVNSLQQRFGQIHFSSKRLAKIIVPSRSIASNIIEVYRRFASRVEQINLGTFAEKTAGCFREEGRLASIVVAGPFGDADELENLFRAVRHLAVNGYEFMLVIMGAGRAERGVREWLYELGLLDIAVIVPRLELGHCVFSASDIFIQPVASKTYNPLLLEAMSVGTAVACCKGGVEDLIIDGETGILFEGGDELSIRGAIQRLLDRREWARKLARGAQEYLRENHSVSQMVTSTLRSYREAVEWYGH